MITTVCNLQCSYCFTADDFATTQGPSHVSAEEFSGWLEFLERSEVDAARLLGGEPTLHPRFGDLVALARSRALHVTVFSNGLMPPSALECLESIDESNCTVVVNMTASDLAPELLEERAQTVGRLGAKATLGFNFDRLDADPTHLLALMDRTECKPIIRVGIAHPCLTGRNTFIHQKQYGLLGGRIAQFALHAQQKRARLDLDCGFVPCMFTPEQKRALDSADAIVGWHCNPILDIRVPDTAFHCFPLAGLATRRVDDEETASSLREWFVAKLAPYRRVGIYAECEACVERQKGVCSGGCLSAAMRRLHRSFSASFAPREDSV